MEGDGDGWEYDAEAVEEEAIELSKATEEAEKWIAKASKRWESRNPACTQVSDAQSTGLPSFTAHTAQTNQNNQPEEQVHDTYTVDAVPTLFPTSS